MPTGPADIDVLIVGAGPVGLLLANECARRGLSARIVESRAGQSEHSKALAVMPRTLEIFDMAGVDYHGSALVEGPGHRYFDESLRGGRGISSRFVLLVGADDESETAAEARHLADDYRNVLELRSGAQAGIALVRPDGYTAYEAYRGAPSAALESVREVLERQVVGST